MHVAGRAGVAWTLDLRAWGSRGEVALWMMKLAVLLNSFA
jgi:hypothetical protein